MKVLDLKKSLKEIVEEHPEVLDIMKELGFNEIVKPGMINTVGRVMTIPKGALMRGIDLDKIKETFKSKGFEIKD
ncbi:hypothetical protein ABG79_00411 [Caloramator mitchellensis]|uniref:DUF1858 domain-containing protein n=1 Tax=Caloramator mitchellensis TaxID=908809 RepID=A0A0R3JX20_CALMK|nr:DUF1858 domain-containing protein [Caloramator mitchellensis]KRQ87610.1 hypothetical protein ABG79_00411 [Caloramator mitchellensis]